jgi:uncharacterized protein (DUF362 family)
MKKITRREFIFRGAGIGIAASLGMFSTSRCVKTLVEPVRTDTPDLVIAKGGDPTNNTKKAIQALGGIERFVTKGDKVVIKPNPITSSPPEIAANTNPLVVETVASLCVQAGASDVVVLSHDGMNGFEGNGILDAAYRSHARVLAAMTRDLYKRVPVLRGRVMREVEIIKDVLDADVFINIPIAKHHAETTLTMSMKNLMGINWDRVYMHQNGIHQCIADLSTVIKHHLVIMDANRILLSNGPNGPGETREEKTIIAGTDPVAVDAYTTRLFNRIPEDIPHIRYAYELGIGEMHCSELNIKEIHVS